MRTKVLPANEETALQEAIRILQTGGIIALPTDTVYGVAAHAFLPEAVARLYVVKERPRDKAIPLLIGQLADLILVAAQIPPVVRRLVTHFWPGALTVIVPRSERVPDAVTAGGSTVAVRLPDHPLVHQLCLALGAPLAATSANRSGQPAPVTAAEVQVQLKGRIPLILDGGACRGGVPSTVVDCTVTPPVILRAGLIPESELRAVLGV